MKKTEIFTIHQKPTLQTFKNTPLYVGDVYKNEVGTMGIVLLDDEGYYYQKTSGVIHRLPDEKAGMKDSEFVGNVAENDDLLKVFIDCKIIEDEETETAAVAEEPVAEKPKKEKTVKKKEEKKEVKMNIYQKINAVRKKWAETNIEKEGKGKLGGAGKFNYYKPQQVIDFCLAAELENNLYSKFTVDVENKMCCYQLINLDNTSEIEDVSCPFEIPRKMVVNEAQQTGAALTYFNRRLAMMIYKIEDNSKESVDVLENADYSKTEDNIPNIPVPPTSSAPIPPTKIELEAPTSPVVPPASSNEQTIVKTPEPVKNDKPAIDVPQNEPVAQQNKDEDLPPWVTSVMKPTVPQTAPQTAPVNSIESLY